MSEDIKWNEMIISDEQAEILSHSIYDDIEVYVEQNTKRFSRWIIDKVILEQKYMIMTICGIEILNNYAYEMCNYNESKYRR